MAAPKTNRGAIAARVAQILPLVVDGVPQREILRFVTEKTNWGHVSTRTLENYIARARAQISAEAKVEAKEVFAQSLARKQRLYTRAAAGGQLKTALAVQNAIDRMFGDYAGLRENDYSDVDRFLRLMRGEEPH